MNKDKDYILGTHDAEIARLALQHRVWRPRVLDAWRRAGFNMGQTIIDVGCGPGYASVDLAEMVGDTGRVVAVDRSRRFLDALAANSASRGLSNISSVEQDLDEGELPSIGADGAWCRWVFAFVKRPRDLLARISRALRPGGVLVSHEYFNYATWRTSPRSPEIEGLVKVVIDSWRSEGGEPDIGLDLLVWLSEAGFRPVTLTPIIDIVPVSNFVWQWPKSFLDVGPKRLVELGRMSQEQADAIAKSFAAIEAAPNSLMITPAVLEIIAVRE